MKKFVLFFFFCALAATGFAKALVLDNQTSYPNKNAKTKMAVQWATSAKEIDEGNSAIIEGMRLNSNSIKFVSQQGKISLSIPNQAEYFRVLVWSQGEMNPDLLTNWVDIVSNKTYMLKADQLVPSVLMLGTGC